jgi:hypothetical protein
LTYYDSTIEGIDNQSEEECQMSDNRYRGGLPPEMLAARLDAWRQKGPDMLMDPLPGDLQALI